MIGLVGEGESAVRAVDTLHDAGVTTETGPADAVLEQQPDAVVAMGEAGIVDLVAAGVEVPVLPVGRCDGIASVPVDEMTANLDALAAENVRLRTHPLIGVESNGASVGRAVFDVMLVRRQPGHISEYAIAAGTARSRFRADGVVIATPAGSHGYAHAAGGPRLAPDVSAVVAVPIAAFGLGAPDWVLDPADGIQLRVTRDEGEVSILVDGRDRATLIGQATVSVTAHGTIQTVVPSDR